MNKGLELTSVENRVNSVDGTIVYGSDGENGFYINIEIPFRSL